MFQEGVKPGEETRMPMTAFPVPSLPPSMLSCSCMRMSYILRVFLVCAKNNVYNHGEHYCTYSVIIDLSAMQCIVDLWTTSVYRQILCVHYID